VKAEDRITKNEWKTATLGDLLEPAETWNPKRSPLDEVLDYIDLSAVDQDAKLITGAREVSCGEAPSRARQLVARGDVLVSTVRPNLNGVARVPDQLDGATASTGFCVLRARESKFDGGYLFHWVKSPAFVADMVNKATGASYPAISDRIIFDSRIPLPPLAEQCRIAEILDWAEALRAKRRAALAHFDPLTQSLFLDIFGDPISNPRKWPQENLETFFHFRTGKLDSNAAVTSGQYPFFTCSREDFRIDTFAFDCEALLLAGNNASADYSVKHYKGKFNAYQRTYVITLRDERNSYAYARFVLEHRLGELKRMSKGTGTKYLTMELLDRIRVPVPPISLQREFARRVTAVEKLKTAQRASLAELNSLFASLQHRAFRGEL
jgi:type I restriction enzyme S subunit